MRDHDGGTDLAGCGKLQAFDHIGSIAAGGADDMGAVVMDIIVIQLCTELGIGRTGKEVQAAVAAQDVAGQFDHAGDRGIGEHVIITAADQAFQVFGCIGDVTGIDEHHLDAGGLYEFLGEQFTCALQTRFIDIGHDQGAGTAVAVDDVFGHAQTHGAGTGQDRHLAAFADAHLMLINAHLGMEGSMRSTDGAAVRLSQGSLKEGVALILEEAAQFENFLRDDAVGAVAAEVGIAVSRAPHGALVVQSGLQGEPHTGLILILVLFADLLNNAGELMTHDGRMIGYIIMHALMLFAQHGAFVSGHADAVGHNLDQHFIVLDLGKFELHQPQVVRAMQAQCTGFHNKCFLLIYI